MSDVLDRAGTFRGKPVEWAISQTKENQLPQFVVKLSALEFYADTPEMMAHFGITEPGYVDWSGYGQEVVAYLVLFNEKGPLLNYEQLQKALGWDGASFSGLAAGDWSEKLVLFRVEESEWPKGSGNMGLKVQWIDAPDAPPERTLRALDATKLTALDQQFAGMLAKKPVVAAKAPAKPAAPTAPGAKAPAPETPAGKPAAAAAGKAPASVPAAPSAATPTSPASTTVAVKTTAPSKAPPAAKPKASAAPTAAAAGVSKEDAWAFLANNKGDKTDDDLGTAWVDAYTAVAPDVEEDALTPAQWLAIQNHAAAKLGIAAA